MTQIPQIHTPKIVAKHVFVELMAMPIYHGLDKEHTHSRAIICTLEIGSLPMGGVGSSALVVAVAVPPVTVHEGHCAGAAPKTRAAVPPLLILV